MVAVDGCGAPLLSTSLTGLARAFAGRRHRDRRTGAAGRRRHPRHPEFVSGTRRDELALLRAVPGSIGKAGAESCYAVGAAPTAARSRSRPTTGPRACGRC